MFGYMFSLLHYEQSYKPPSNIGYPPICIWKKNKTSFLYIRLITFEVTIIGWFYCCHTKNAYTHICFPNSQLNALHYDAMQKKVVQRHSYGVMNIYRIKKNVSCNALYTLFHRGRPHPSRPPSPIAAALTHRRPLRCGIWQVWVKLFGAPTLLWPQ